jgi:hypothetical protein
LTKKVQLRDKPRATQLRIATIREASPTNNPSLLFWLAQDWNASIEGHALQSVDGVEISSNGYQGMIQVGVEFNRFLPLYGLSLLVHEAKHSECPDGLDALTSDQLRRAADLGQLASALAQYKCGFSHSLCSADNPMAGKLSCDSSLDGPYTAQYVFNRAIVKYCTNCSFSEKALMQIFALDAAARIPLPSMIAVPIAEANENLSTLQSKTPAKEFINDLLEERLRPVDDFINSNLYKE